MYFAHMGHNLHYSHVGYFNNRIEFSMCGFSKAGHGLQTVLRGAAKEPFDLTPEQILAPGRYPKVVQARSLLCYWVVRELGVTATSLAKQMGLTQPAVSIAVKRGEKIAEAMNLNLEEPLK